MLHAVVREHLQTFLEEARERSEQGSGLPRFISDQFERYLECGVLANGFARFHCGDCGHDLLVAFSCKRRGVCPSCNTRRMHDTAAHLVLQMFIAQPRHRARAVVAFLRRYDRSLLEQERGGT